ncbi:MAG: exopolysaccharide phosphotransferase [Nitrosomonadales bacterium]|nr:exopolysaccharide phosphotransferase [Nitrosomonadales bacterium]
MSDMETQIDVVYLWVNSNDKKWQNKRRNSFDIFLNNDKDNIALYANTDGRFRDNGELIFNLRCLENFFPKHGHVYIVTDEQRPAWLSQNKNVTIIDHKDIIPNKVNSIFASANIESYIHHIPNLSENFFYLNDDIFFGMPVDKQWWFDKELKYFYDNEPHDEYSELQSMLLSPINASIQSKLWLKEKYKNYKHQNIALAHAPRPYKKSLLFKIEREAIDLFNKVRSTNFRSWKTPAVLVDFVPRWLEHHGYAKIKQMHTLYIESGSNDTETKLDQLTQEFGKIPFFCINDTCDNAEASDKRLLLVKEKLQKILPKKSSFEI